MKLGCLKIHELQVTCIIGDLDWERTTPQTIKFNLDLHFDWQPVIEQEALENTANYVAVLDDARSFAIQGKYQLVENLTADLATYLKEKYTLEKIKVTLFKEPAGLVGISGITAEYELP